MTRLYEREIKDFFEVAKIKMAGTSKEAKGKFGKITVELVCFVLTVSNMTLSCTQICVFCNISCSHLYLGVVTIHLFHKDDKQ